MDELIKRIKGDFFDIKENCETLTDIEKLFPFPRPVLNNIISQMRFCVEQGIVEYKKNIIVSLFSLLESLKYDSKGFEFLKKQKEELSALVYVTLIQRLLASGKISIKHKKKQEPEYFDSKDDNIKQIIEQLNNRVKKDRSFANNPAVKTIFLQIKIYWKEFETMKKLEPNILPGKEASFRDNYKKTFDSITNKIRDNYALIIKEESVPEEKPEHPLEKYDFNPLASFYLMQAQKISEIRSVVIFAETERFNTREILLKIIGSKSENLALLEKEMDKYNLLDPVNNGGRIISRTLSTEIINILEKQTAWAKES